MSDEIKVQRDRFMGFSFAAADLLMELDEQGTILFCVGAAQTILNSSAESLIGHPFERFVCKTDRTLITFLFDGLKKGERKGPLKVELVKNDTPHATLISLFRMPGADGKISLIINSANPIDPAMMDPNRHDDTGLLKQNAFFEMTQSTIENARKTGSDINMTVIDLPDEEILEQQMGVENASDFKHKTASFLRSVSVSDTATKFNEEKFGVIHEKGVASERISSEIENISKEYNEGDAISISSNFVEIDTNVNSQEMANALAYTIKQYVDQSNTENGQTVSFEKQVNSQISNTIDQIKWFKNIIKRNKIHYVGQQIVANRGKHVHHYELLIRFEHNVSPFQRLVFAEKVGIIHELDLTILKQAIDWINSTPNNKDFSLAVNISGASLARADFCFKMLKLINEELKYPKRLLIEITESAEIESLKKVNDFFKNIRNMGIKLCIDDFGAGSASLNYIRALDVDIVKIDGQYIRESMKSGREDKILRAMIHLCKSMKMNIVAEQIETDEQAKYLSDLGVEFGQGYLFHKPEPMKNILKALPGDKKRA